MNGPAALCRVNRTEAPPSFGNALRSRAPCRNSCDSLRPTALPVLLFNDKPDGDRVFGTAGPSIAVVTVADLPDLRQVRLYIRRAAVAASFNRERREIGESHRAEFSFVSFISRFINQARDKPATGEP